MLAFGLGISVCYAKDKVQAEYAEGSGELLS
jgi:hypothetical protein